MTALPETRYARTRDGLEIAFQAGPSAGRDVAFLPYVCGVDVMWEDTSLRHVLERLGRIGRMICFDYRGMGASDPVPMGGVPTPETWMEDLRAVLDAAGSAKCAVVANGSAGFMGMIFAATYPDRVTALVLIDAFARMASGDGQDFGPTPEQVDAAVQMNADRWGTDETVRVFAPARVDDRNFRQWYGRYHRYVMSRGVARSLIGWNFGLDLRAVTSAIHVPTLVISQGNGFLVGTEHSRWLANTIPEAKLLVMPGGSGHFMFNPDTVEDVLDATEEFITGVPPVRDPDRALTTVMFTDIVASTQHASRLGDKAWAGLLDRHDTLIERELSRHRGRRVNPTGDGILATFDGPARGVRCAQAIIEVVRSLGIDVRAGLHTGEVELRGDDIGGIAVHIGQRISALAGSRGGAGQPHCHRPGCRKRPALRGPRRTSTQRSARHLARIRRRWLTTTRSPGCADLALSRQRRTRSGSPELTAP